MTCYECQGRPGPELGITLAEVSRPEMLARA
jgi:hypothetical protein